MAVLCISPSILRRVGHQPTPVQSGTTTPFDVFFHCSVLCQTTPLQCPFDPLMDGIQARHGTNTDQACGSTYSAKHHSKTTWTCHRGRNHTPCHLVRPLCRPRVLAVSCRQRRVSEPMKGKVAKSMMEYDSQKLRTVPLRLENAGNDHDFLSGESPSVFY